MRFLIFTSTPKSNFAEYKESTKDLLKYHQVFYQ